MGGDTPEIREIALRGRRDTAGAGRLVRERLQVPKPTPTADKVSAGLRLRQALRLLQTHQHSRVVMHNNIDIRFDFLSFWQFLMVYFVYFTASR